MYPCSTNRYSLSRLRELEKKKKNQRLVIGNGVTEENLPRLSLCELFFSSLSLLFPHIYPFCNSWQMFFSQLVIIQSRNFTDKIQLNTQMYVKDSSFKKLRYWVCALRADFFKTMNLLTYWSLIFSCVLFFSILKTLCNNPF